MSAGDPLVLSYHDVSLRQSDLDLLPPPNWFNDQLIAFWFEYLAQDKHPELQQEVALLPGATTFLLSNVAPEEAGLVFESLKLRDKQLVCLAVNDNQDVSKAAGGSHWSLLCYHRYTNTLRHYDSCHSSNQRACRKVASCLSPLVQQPGRREPNYVEVTHAPQQSNPDDCGPHTLAVAQQLLAWAAAGRLYELEVLERELRRRLDSQHVQQLRTTMCNVINQLRGKVLEGVRPAGAQVV